MTRTLLISSFLCSALMMIGCGDDGKGQATKASDDGGSETTGPANPSASSDPGTGDTPKPTSSADPTETTNVMTNPGSASNGTGDEGCGFVCDTTGGNATISQCDVFKQDCPEGEKCTAYDASGGNSWNATKCVAVTGTGTPGDACKVEGSGVSGLDDCQKGAMCWDTNAQNKGLCVELCGGTKASPTCSNEADFNCAVFNEGVLSLCLPSCDPLLQDCAGDDLCVDTETTFVCVLDGSGPEGQQFDPCEYSNSCDRGLACLLPKNGMECNPKAKGCCLPYCDIDDVDFTCPGKGQKCTSVFQAGMAPPEYEKVGWCTIPS